MLHDVCVFLVEDDELVALSVSMSVEASRGKILGPFPTVAEAIAMLQGRQPDVAVLDANLKDGQVTPVAALLAARSIPFLFHSGDMPELLARNYPAAPVMKKPTSSFRLVYELQRLVGRGRPPLM
jgi:CheY-like chemotaxis protein